MISAKIIAESINEQGSRLTTFVIVLPRIVLAELNTHRALSKNSASSRAIPYKKMLETVKNNPFVPIRWQKDHSGMQGTEYFEGEAAEKCNRAIETAESFNEIEQIVIPNGDNGRVEVGQIKNIGLTKQLVNRVLEAYMWHTVIISGTEWENFFALRAEGAAEIHIQALAFEMLKVYNESIPKELKKGEWHIPFGDNIDEEKLKEQMPDIQPASLQWYMEQMNSIKIKIATARCAGVSYTVVGTDGKEEDFTKLLKRHDMLTKMGHWSPSEHVAVNMDDKNHYGNFKGWKQYRKFFENENKTDERVKKYKTV